MECIEEKVNKLEMNFKIIKSILVTIPTFLPILLSAWCVLETPVGGIQSIGIPLPFIITICLGTALSMLVGAFVSFRLFDRIWM